MYIDRYFTNPPLIKIEKSLKDVKQKRKRKMGHWSTAGSEK